MDRRAAREPLGVGLAERGCRALGWRNRVDELGPGLVAEQERRPGPLRMPLDVVRERAQEDVGPDPSLGPMMDRADGEIDRLDRPP